MKALALLCGAAVFALAITACNQAPPAATVAPDTHDADVKAISDTEAQWLSDWAAKDAEKIASHYADDAVLIVSGMDPVKGKDAILGFTKQMVSDKAISMTFKSFKVDVAKSGDLGYAVGDYKLTVTNPATHKPVEDHGTYVVTCRKQVDGSWKAVNDIATSSVPPGGPPKHK